jgi:hypothetical protein
MFQAATKPSIDASEAQTSQSSFGRQFGEQTIKPSTPTKRPVDDGIYQRQLADLLLETMEIHDAIQFCLEHGWERTLLKILPNKSHT